MPFYLALLVSLTLGQAEPEKEEEKHHKPLGVKGFLEKLQESKQRLGAELPVTKAEGAATGARSGCGLTVSCAAEVETQLVKPAPGLTSQSRSTGRRCVRTVVAMVHALERTSQDFDLGALQ